MSKSNENENANDDEAGVEAPEHEDEASFRTTIKVSDKEALAKEYEQDLLSFLSTHTGGRMKVVRKITKDGERDPAIPHTASAMAVIQGQVRITEEVEQNLSYREYRAELE